uniref:F-box and leucine rich repeat protein 13 n=1 Tax=Fundulus heteroclitus TaxID=8078 RepID=A0A3Q2PYC0_FUNHE
MIQRITEGCPCLLYLNLSSTLVTDHSLKAIFSLQYLSLAHCRRFTDEGFLCLTTEKGARNLTHLNLSECSQVTNGFRYISAGCPSLTEVVINDMPTLSDSCVLVSFLFPQHFRCYTKDTYWSVKTRQKKHSNNQITDVSWQALCSHSQGLCRLQAADCPGMTDDSLRYVASLKSLKYLDISLCSRWVADAGIKCLTDGSSTDELHHLSISRCCLVTDNSVRRIARRYLARYCERLTDPAVELLSGSSICSLDLSGCNIQDQLFIITSHVPFGQKLCKNTRDLEHVDVSHCVALSDAAIRAVSFYCRGLLTLKMSGCPKMSDMAVLYLTSGSQYLRELDMSGCTLLTDRSLRHLKRICPPLTSIRMTCCSSISWAAAIKLQARVSHWEYSNFNPSSCFDCSANQ